MTCTPFVLLCLQSSVSLLFDLSPRRRALAFTSARLCRILKSISHLQRFCFACTCSRSRSSRILHLARMQTNTRMAFFSLNSHHSPNACLAQERVWTFAAYYLCDCTAHTDWTRGPTNRCWSSRWVQLHASAATIQQTRETQPQKEAHFEETLAAPLPCSVNHYLILY